jgi:hypothetical protein
MYRDPKMVGTVKSTRCSAKPCSAGLLIEVKTQSRRAEFPTGGYSEMEMGLNRSGRRVKGMRQDRHLIEAAAGKVIDYDKVRSTECWNTSGVKASIASQIKANLAATADLNIGSEGI